MLCYTILWYTMLSSLHSRVLRGLRLLVQVEDVHVVRHGQVLPRRRYYGVV